MYLSKSTQVLEPMSESCTCMNPYLSHVHVIKTRYVENNIYEEKSIPMIAFLVYIIKKYSYNYYVMTMYQSSLMALKVIHIHNVLKIMM